MAEDAGLSERVSALLKDQQDPEALVTVLHRTAVELNKLARAQAAATKGSAEWGGWAGLQNATRGLVLQASTCRDLVKKLKPSASQAPSDTAC